MLLIALGYTSMSFAAPIVSLQELDSENKPVGIPTEYVYGKQMPHPPPNSAIVPYKPENKVMVPFKPQNQLVKPEKLDGPKLRKKPWYYISPAARPWAAGGAAAAVILVANPDVRHGIENGVRDVKNQIT